MNIHLYSLCWSNTPMSLSCDGTSEEISWEEIGSSLNGGWSSVTPKYCAWMCSLRYRCEFVNEVEMPTGWIYSYTYINMSMPTRMSMCLSLHVYQCVYAYTYINMSMPTRISISLCLHAYQYVYAYTYINMFMSMGRIHLWLSFLSTWRRRNLE